MKTLGRFVCPWQNRLALPAGLLCALVAGASATTNSPAPYAARLWQMEDGLPHTIVQAITQTRDGYLWVGTREGLARFDGVTFHSLTAKDFGTGLMQPSVTCLCEAPNRSLWIGTENVGLFRLQDGKLAHLTRADGLRDNMIYGLAATSDGSLWVAAGGLGQLRDGKLQYPFEKEVKRDVSSLFLDSDGVLWIVGTDVKQLKAGKVTSYTPAKGRLPGTLKCLVSDWNGTLWGRRGVVLRESRRCSPLY